MPAVNGVGEPCAGEPHARIEVAGAGNGARNRDMGTGMAQPSGKPAEHEGPRPYTPAKQPRQSPTLLEVPGGSSAPFATSRRSSTAGTASSFRATWYTSETITWTGFQQAVVTHHTHPSNSDEFPNGTGPVRRSSGSSRAGVSLR